MGKFFNLTFFFVALLANQIFGADLLGTICDDQTVVFGIENSNTAIIGTTATEGLPPYAYEWSTGENTASITVSPTTTTVYNVTVSDSAGDAVVLEHTVTVVDVRCGGSLENITMCHPSSSPHTHCVKAKDVAKKLGEGWSFGECDLDLSTGNCPIPEKIGCGCEGGMVNITLQYNGTGAALITGFAEKNGQKPLESYTNVQSGDLLTFTASAANLAKLKAKTYLSVDGGAELEVHTSCSENIQGMEIGDMTVVIFTDGLGYTCEAPKCECSGNAQTLTVQYNGPAGANIKVFNDINLNAQALLGVFINVNPGDVFTLDAASLGLSELNDFVYFSSPALGSNSYHLYTACNDDILGNFGDFSVLSFTDEADGYCPVPPLNCDCKGGIRAIAFTYTGTSAATIEVYNKNNLLTTFSNVASGDELLIEAPVGDDKLEKDVTITVVGQTDVELHTSCSQDILGNYGAIEITGFVDKEFSNCNVPDYEAPPEPCDCKGGIRAIAFTYTGAAAATIEVYNKNNLLTTFSNVAQGDELLILAPAGDDKLEKDVTITVVGQTDVELHTSCSQDILGNYGAIEITGFVDKEFSNCNVPDYEAPPEPCDCKGGMSVIGLVYTGTGGDITFYSGGTAILTVTAATGDTIIFSAADAGLEKFDKNSAIGAPGQANVDIHTSCSVNILGTYGDINIFGYADKEFTNVCNISDIDLPPVPCACKGGMSAIQFTYTGPNNGTVEVYNGNALFATYTALSNGQVLLIESNPADKLEKDVSIRMAGQANVDLHTSCSKPVLGNYGFVEVTGYTDKEGSVCNMDDGSMSPRLAKSTGLSYMNAFPNPLVDQVNIHFELPETEQVTMRLYNIQGQLVDVIFDEEIEGKTKQQINFSFANLSAGIYLVKATTPSGLNTVLKLVVAK